MRVLSVVRFVNWSLNLKCFPVKNEAIEDDGCGNEVFLKIPLFLNKRVCGHRCDVIQETR